ncbi:hypothetical protein HF086_003810 [Spodoptera exigua]|uniref:LIM zinc-binding domain-containing protein n=1 Tax=Spodoptera exigua TaxID=7107 RepID=A0A922SNV1_SPOEX|nr:hypothetical protein HF086_003810 [Spodoptera exigua]
MPPSTILEACPPDRTFARSAKGSSPEPSHFYSRASVARAGTPCSLHRTHRSRSRTPRVVSTPQPTQPTPPVARACAGTQTPQEKLAPEPPHRPSIPMGCHEVLPDGRIALGAPALPQPRDALPVVNDTPYCSDCNRYIIGVFVRIKDKNLHVECFKCSTCGTSLKNQGYYNLNGKLYCDIHAKLVARNNPPAPNLEPVTVPPGSRIPSNTYSTPLPPLATSNYTNGSSSLFSPSSNLSGPKPFGSSIGSAYSPSLSPRSAPMSPARPVTAPALAPAPLAAPISAPQPAAPFAPTQNVKSIVWPPPANPSDDEPPKYEPSIKPGAPACAKEQGTRVLNKINPNSDSTIADVQQQSMEKFIASSKQREEFTSSSVSYASAAMSSMTATSKSESVVQSKQSQVVQESTSRTIQSFSQESSECQSTTVYQTQTCPPKSFENSSDAIENIKTQMIQSKENIQSRTAKEVESTNITEPPNDQVKAQQPQKTDTKIESDNGSAIQVSAQINTKENNQVCNEALMQKNNEEIVVNQQTATFDTQSKTSIEKTQTEPPIANAHMAATENIQKTMNPSGLDPNAKSSMVDALTTAPDRPYSPLPTAQQPINLTGQTMAEEKPTQYDSEEKSELKECAEIKDVQLPAQPSPMFSQEKRGITPIPPIKTYNPPEKVAPPVPMPEETKPYIPPDFKIVIEPKEPRETTSTPLIEALTIAPDRPFTPVATYDQNQAISRESYDQNQTMSNGPYDQTQSIGRGSLREALTIAPDRPYSPFGTPGVTQSNQYMTSTTHVTETNLSEIVKPIATQTLTQTSDQLHSEFSTMQNTCKLQSSSEMSAFRPVPKQVFPPPQPEEFCKLTNFPPISNELKTSFTQATKTKQETTFSESMVVQQSSLSTSMATQGYSTVKTAQNYFEQLDKKESLTSTAVRSKSGLHKPDSIPPYQKNFEQLLSQRGISPDIYNAPAVLQRPVTPSTGTPTRPKEKSVEPHPTYSTPQTSTPKFQQVRTPVQQPPVQFHKDTPITMTFQPVTDDNFMRVPSPSRSSRPVTPNSLINKPAPIIPHYQMNLVTVEHLAPESHLFEPSSREGSRSPTPKPRSRSPAQGPPPNPLKAHAPRIKESAPQNYSMDSFSSQDPSNWRKQHERDQKEFQTAAEIYNTGGGNKNWASQPPIVKEQRHSNVGYKSENYTKGDMKIKEDSLIQENYGQRQMQSQNVIAQGNTTVQTTRKTFEEYERTQSAKVVEIRKGGSSIAGAYEQNMDCNIRPSNLNPKQVFPPPMMSLPSTQQSSSLNLTNQNMTSASRTIDNYDPKPSISGANQGPVCDPTPSTGSSVGAAARGKTFGVSSAPKRGRGVLNKAALPGSRVPLCASCNGNISEPLTTSSPHKTEFKSPAEERLIRKMAKMALNGYEIGIQRKIKPADHIQSMADKIQDTVVTKHPLNSDGIPAVENNNIKTVERSYKTHENIQSIGDKIKDTIKNNHPANESTPKPNVLIPPPLPSTPIPTFNVHSTPLGHSINTNGEKKKYDTIPRTLNASLISDERVINNNDKSHNGSGYSSTEDLQKDKIDNNYLGTLRKTGIEKSSFLNSMNGSIVAHTNSDVKPELKFDTPYSNTLNKRKLFEKPDNLITNNKVNEKVNNAIELNVSQKINNFDYTSKNENGVNQDEDLIKSKEVSGQLYNNSLYSYKSPTNNKINSNGNEHGNDCVDKVVEEIKSIPDSDEKQNTEEEVVVRRRQKKNIRNDDGRRDSHIIARPLSTIQCADVAEGLYPVCHKCDKAITRGPFITALGRIWCPEHFICVNATCRRPLQDIGFVEENGQLYCEFCFEQYIAPACDKCHAKIKGDCLNAIGKHYHPECFNCVYCGKLFGNNPFFLEDGLPYCEADWNDLFTTKCFACGFPVEAGDRCAKRTSKDRVSSPREVDLSVRHTPARSPQQMMYNSDTVYTTTTFRPVSPSPITPPLNTPSPQRTRKLETPLHFDGGLFSDIRSTDGKLLSKVTVDRVQQSSRHDITDSPSVFTDGKNYVDDIVKTETITNENVITVKFTPVPPELDSPRLLTPSQMYKTRQKTPVEYIKDNFEDLQSYKIVSSVVKEKLLEKENLTPVLNEGGIFENHDTFANTTCKENVYEKDSFISDSNVKEKLSTSLDTFEPIKRAPSPLANLFISEQLTKIDSYLQESLEVCTGVKDRYTPIPIIIEGEKSGLVDDAEMASCVKETYDQKEVNFSTTEIKPSSNNKREDEPLHRREKTTPEPYSVEYSKTNVSKLNSAKQAGVLSVIYNMPIHYHAAILCFLLIIYNLIYQYVKQNCYGSKNKIE